ncbi:hypothetical protein [Phenylobacterium sp.]|uniref:terminase small subunit-like protein n=1 Tax=Phenylobacterium sp. TaxID=1871053 RepID=UPI0035697056
MARSDAGEALSAVCASPGLPGVDSVRAWARDDAAFGEALAAARRRGRWRRLWAFDEAKAAAFLARARAGEPIKSLCGRPGMPSREQYLRWRTSQPPFAEATFALLQRRNARARAWGLARRRDFDPALADRIIVRMNSGLTLADVLAEDPDMPGAVTLARWRRQEPEFDAVLRTMFAARRGAAKPVPEVLVQDIVEHIVEGGSFASYSRLPGAPWPGTLRKWLRDPHFAEEVAQACEFRKEWYHDQILMIAQGAREGPLPERRHSIGALKQQLSRLRDPSRPPKRKPPGSGRPFRIERSGDPAGEKA